ncbi:Nitric oxide synthase, endothelial, partial [Armadillidium nasatum]
DPHEYEEWKHLKYPNLVEVLEEFPSVQIEPALFFTQLPLLQPRFYSISSSPLVHKDEIHITVAVVIYRTEESIGDMMLFFGCRTKALDLYREEKEEMVNQGVLKNTYLALSREPSLPKVSIFF